VAEKRKKPAKKKAAAKKKAPAKDAFGCTPKQARFAHEYVIDHNGTQAAIRAGYTEKSAHVTASKLLKNPKVAALVRSLTRASFARVAITQDRVNEEIARIAFADLGKFVRWGPDGVTLVDSDLLPEEATCVVAEVSETVTQFGGTKRIKMHDKVGALRDLAKLFEDSLESPEERAAAIFAALSELNAATTTSEAA
jgi:phage terminase small subunit